MTIINDECKSFTNYIPQKLSQNLLDEEAIPKVLMGRFGPLGKHLEKL